MSKLRIFNSFDLLWMCVGVLCIGFLLGYVVGWVDGESETIKGNAYIGENIVWKQSAIYHCTSGGLCNGTN